MRRREFITLLGGAAAGWPAGAQAQHISELPMIGFLGADTPSAWNQRVVAFSQRLRELGWIESRTIAIDYRWADGRSDLFDEIAADFVQRRVDVIVTAGTAAVFAVRKATSVIPIVFAAELDPVGSGLVDSLARPGGNATGLSLQQSDLAAKRLELLREVLPILEPWPSWPMQALPVPCSKCARLSRRLAPWASMPKPSKFAGSRTSRLPSKC